jgi:hypothetical protein
LIVYRIHAEMGQKCALFRISPGLEQHIAMVNIEPWNRLYFTIYGDLGM